MDQELALNPSHGQYFIENIPYYSLFQNHPKFYKCNWVDFNQGLYEWINDTSYMSSENINYFVELKKKLIKLTFLLQDNFN